MKAKEYAEKYKPLFERYRGSEEIFKQVMSDLFKEFMKEIDNLKDKRHITTLDSIVSLLNEGSQKWKALAQLLPEIKPEGFRDFWANKIPKVKDLLK